MFSNPVYNRPPKFNENLLSQNLSGLSLTSAPTQQQQQQQQQTKTIEYESFQFSQQQQIPVDIGSYVPPSLNDTDTDISYDRGSTLVRQYNNSMIDDYYKKFLRPITDYIAIPTNGQPTYVYQNLGGPPNSAPVGLNQQPYMGVEVANDQQATVLNPSSDLTGDQSEEKKHKKKNKKRSSKHPMGDNNKNSDNEGANDESHRGIIDFNDHQTPSVLMPSGNQQKQVVGPAILKKTGAVGPQVPMKFPSNPLVYFDIEIDNELRGRLVMELFRHVLPRTAQNFLSLTLNEHGFGYRLSYFHRIIPGFMAQAGDFEKSNGTGGYSIYGEKFDDEGFPYQHDRAGLLSMANSGPNTNGSQFFVTFAPCPHLDNKHVVFGQVIQGFHLLKDLDLCGSETGEILREIKIAATGQLQ
ncbi:unnamed protein product [Rotaria sordida]|uniref:peptidylprolyl isomerase n=1 Tax=Rotaria sordida TaxID=392033 RepID=A0A815KCY2_9BILA|nr:unnamed protein product [Rotaria sordida]CAF1391227.1 unnamed protein product [Rotaria sordida]